MRSTLGTPRASRCGLAVRVACALALGHGGSAAAQITFDVIGPHEYELPVDFDPFNVFVQYGMVQEDDRLFNRNGDRVDGSGAQRIVGMSKYVRFWSPESNRNIGVAWEVIVPEVAIRNRNLADADDRHVSGIGDPLTGFAIWYKPAANATLGFQSFVQIPVGTEKVSDTNWKNLSSFFWDWRITDKLGWTGDAGIVWQTRRDNGIRPGLSWHTNHRFGWRASQRLEPFLAIDAEYLEARDGAPSAHVIDAGPGLMIHTFANQSISLRYSTSVDGRNHSVNDSFNIKYAYVW